MQQSDKIGEYLKAVCEQIRWKKAHNVIAKEIENHILDQQNAFMAQGLDEINATEKAIKEMGDPTLIGSQLDRTHRPKPEWSIIVLTGIALFLGLVVRAFVTYDSDQPWLLMNSILTTIIGAGFMAVAYFLDFTVIGKYPKIVYFGLIAATIGIMTVSPVINGRHYYAQYLLLFFPTAFAGIVYNARIKRYPGIVLAGVSFIVPAFVGMTIPSFSNVALYLLACLFLLTLAITKGWFNVRKLNAMLLVYVPVVTGMAAFLAILFRSQYRWKRLALAFNPSLDPPGLGYLATITRDMIGGAKFFGQGDMSSRPGAVLPGVDTDFLLTYLIHRFGWISFIVVMTVIAAFIIRSFVLCSSQKSVLGRLVSTSVLISFIIQVALYVISNLGFQLLSPLSLPLVSYGGTSTVINMMLIGIMLSVFKSGSLVRDKLKTSIVGRNKLIEIVDGKLIIDFNPKRYP